MNKNLHSLLLTFSLALNFSFVGLWGYHRFYVGPKLKEIQATAANQSGTPQPGRRADRRPARLGPQQWERLRGRVETARPELLRIREDMRRRREEMLALLSAPEVNREAIARCEVELAEGYARMQRIVIESLVEVSKQLPPEQRGRLWQRFRSGPPRYPAGREPGIVPGPRGHGTRPVRNVEAPE